MGLAVPLPPSPTVVLVTWELVLFDDFPLDIHIGPAVYQSIEDGLPAYSSNGSVLAMSPASGSAGVPVATINGGVSAVPEHISRNQVLLEQCQPNPFNPRTTIRYSLAREGRVTLVVHGISGRTVRVLVADENVGPGEHDVVWDGLDGAGGEAASGVYFYRIEALGVSKTMRMTLVR